MVAVWRARQPVGLSDLRVAGGLMLAAAAVRPIHGPGLPCPLRTLTGVPCPLCGMTTSVTDTVHGHLGAALAANPVGVLAVAVAVALLVWRRAEQVRVPAAALPIALAAMWLFELHRFHFL
jgi:small neutral amino acid transporter SnatA (MarC family)